MDEGLNAGFDLDDLFREIERYLEAVAFFRAAGYEPRWR